MLDDSPSPTYRIAVNTLVVTGKIPPGDARWSTFNDTFQNRELPSMDIADSIYTGHAYCNWMAGRRNKENFLSSQVIAVDMDTDDERSSFDTLLCHDLVQMYAGLMHTTPSHMVRGPRARILFFLDKPINTVTGYEEALRFVWSTFDGADPSCVDAAHFFYGSLNCDIWTSDNVFPLDQLRRYYLHWKRTQPQPRRENIIRMDDYRNQDIAGPVRQAVNGNRNNTLNRQSFIAGCAVVRGHVSEAEIEQRLLDAARAVQLGETEALRTIRSGIRAGIAKGA